ncbi:MAG: hypothetical protein SFW65_01455 [Alphaproteobacteria bacterium]|nr:hypothetical protein [Alphaproteobacteria bacterium]
MAAVLQPITLHLSTKARRLRAQLNAAWPQDANPAGKKRAIHAISSYIKTALTHDYDGDVSLFLSNETENSAAIEQGFLYHLTQHHIITTPQGNNRHRALLYVHYETALAAEKAEEKNDTTIPQSRIEQIKQWQQETVKAVLQCMADTALSMEAQTALRGAMTGLNKLGALINASSKSTIKQRAQKNVHREVASTLSDVRSSLNGASANGIKPPSKAQMAIRAQLNKLDKILPAQQKLTAKAIPAVKAAIKRSLVQRPASKRVTIGVKTLRKISVGRTTLLSHQHFRIAPRLVAILPRILPPIATLLRHGFTTVQRFSIISSKPIFQKLAVTLRTPLVKPAQRMTMRFQVSRPAMIARRVAPIAIPARQAQQPMHKAPLVKAPILPIMLPHKPQSQIVLPASANRQYKPPIIPQRIARQPAQYAAIATSVAPPRQIAQKATTMSIAPLNIRYETLSLPATIPPVVTRVEAVIRSETAHQAPLTTEKMGEPAPLSTATSAPRSLIEKLRGAQQIEPPKIETQIAAQIEIPKAVAFIAPQLLVSTLIVPPTHTAPPAADQPHNNIIQLSERTIHKPQHTRISADTTLKADYIAVPRTQTDVKSIGSNVIQFKRPAVVSPIQKLRDGWLGRERNNASVGTLAFAGSRVVQTHAIRGDSITILPAPLSSSTKGQQQDTKKKVKVLKIGICGPC